MEIPDPKSHNHELFETDYSNEWAEEHFKLYFPNSNIIDHGYWLCECGYDKFDVLYYDGKLRNIVIENEKITKRKEYRSTEFFLTSELLVKSFCTSVAMKASYEFGMNYVNSKSGIYLVLSLFFAGIALAEILDTRRLDKEYLEHKEVWEKYEKAMIEKTIV